LSVTVTLTLNGVPVPVQLDDEALAAIAAVLSSDHEPPAPVSPYMTIVEVAEYLRCSRQRIDDLLSARRLERVKEGARTLVRRSDLDAYLKDGGAGRRRQ
jgi:excisionase family DNA binding protein